jgi:hypothetical protein
VTHGPAYRESTSLGGSQSFWPFAVKTRGSHSFRNAEIPGSLHGIIGCKKSAERWNVINDKNGDWTGSAKHHEPYPQQDYDVIHITLMYETRRRLLLLTLTVVG